MKCMVVVTGIVAFVVGFLCGGFIDWVPREARAQNDLIRVERAIRHFYELSHRLPVSLDEAGVAEYQRLKLTNVYGNPIEYGTTNDFQVVLRARGYGNPHARVQNFFVRCFDVRER